VINGQWGPAHRAGRRETSKKGTGSWSRRTTLGGTGVAKTDKRLPRMNEGQANPNAEIKLRRGERGSTGTEGGAKEKEISQISVKREKTECLRLVFPKSGHRGGKHDAYNPGLEKSGGEAVCWAWSSLRKVRKHRRSKTLNKKKTGEDQIESHRLVLTVLKTSQPTKDQKE